jgi:hypothetical protein
MFFNKTDLPISAESWKKKSYGLSFLHGIVIQPGEKIVLESSVDEWILTLYHLSTDEYRIWEKKDFFCKGCLRIGKFSSNKYITGDYGIFDWQEFECIMQDEIIIFQYSRKQESLNTSSSAEHVNSHKSTEEYNDSNKDRVPETTSDEESIASTLSNDEYNYQNIIHENHHLNCFDDCLICKAIF